MRRRKDGTGGLGAGGELGRKALGSILRHNFPGFVAYCLLPTPYSLFLPPSAYCLLLTAYCSSPAPSPYCLPSDSRRPSRYPRRKEICWLVARTKRAISGKRGGVTRVAGPATLKAAITRPV